MKIKLLILLLLTSNAWADPEIRITDKWPKNLCAPNSKAWECRPCENPPNVPAHLLCQCKYCINPAIGKTVEKDNDLREIVCAVPNET